jgi:hypothetical protein
VQAQLARARAARTLPFRAPISRHDQLIDVAPDRITSRVIEQPHERSVHAQDDLLLVDQGARIEVVLEECPEIQARVGLHQCGSGFYGLLAKLAF